MIFSFLFDCADLKACAVDYFSTAYERPPSAMTEARKNALVLKTVATGLPQITDIQFFPKNEKRALVAQKEGQISLVELGTSIENTTIHSMKTLAVRSESEQGLLGIAIDPDFMTSHTIYLHFNPQKGERRSEVSEWFLDIENKELRKKRIVLEVPQPYGNHNGGQIAIGEDHHLYIALGDGGWREDPHQHGQNKNSPLGAILRLNIDNKDTIATDNPFFGQEGVDDRIWVSGLRNPWRFSFLDSKHIIIADVGQNAYEEISIASKGDNLGWNCREGEQQFSDDEHCQQQEFVDPIFTYDHSVGSSITGGYVVLDGSAMQGKYIYGDFVSGRIWALDLRSYKEITLMQSGMNISTFARNSQGTIFVADFATGTISQLEF